MEGSFHSSTVKPAILGATLATFGAHLVIDRQGYEGLEFLIALGTMAFDGTNHLAWKVQAGDESDGSDMADIAASEYAGAKRSDNTAWDRLNNAAADDEEVFTITVKPGNKRYYRLFSTEAGTVSVIGSAIARLYHPRGAPV